MVEAPPVQKQPTLCGASFILGVAAVGWLIAWILAVGPREQLILEIGALLGVPALAVAWLLLVLLRFGLRRRIGAVGWLTVPCVFAAAWLLPWSDWQFRSAFNSSKPMLAALASEFSGLAPGQTERIQRDVGSFEIVRVQRYQGGILLTMSVSPDGESGLVYSTTDQPPTAPEWAVYHSCTPIELNWWRYGWSNP